MHENFFAQLRKCEKPVVLLEGTRALPANDYPKLVKMGRTLAELLPGCVFRSGNASGSDEAFIKGVAAVRNSSIEIFLPFKSFRKGLIPMKANVLSLEELNKDEINSIKEININVNPKLASLLKLYEQGNSSVLSMKAAFLLRDVLKVTGHPSQGFLAATNAVFYVNKESPDSGGTGNTKKTCAFLGIDFYLQEDYLY